MSSAIATGGPRLARFERVDALGLELLRAWPRDERRASFEYLTPDGSRVAAQWRADQARLREVAAETARRAPAGDVEMAGPVLIQAGGADRRLPALSKLARLPGATLVAHRPERRGVVALPDGDFAKVVPAGRAPAIAQAAELARDLAGDAFAVAAPLSRTDCAVTLARVPGGRLHDLLAGPSATAAVAATGRALRALHERPLPPGLLAHGPAEEAAVTRMWLRRVAGWAPEIAERVAPELDLVEARLHDCPKRPAVAVHRDVHDKQVLVAGDGSIGILDFDLLAAGEPALDLANLLVHLELRRLQGIAAPGLDRVLLDAYDPSASVARRLTVHADAARLRLACVYSLRPRSRHVVEPLLAAVG